MIKFSLILIASLFYFLNAQANPHYPSVGNPAAQILFEKGMLNYYGYLYIQAEADFKQAIDKDPNCGLCYFGLAIAKRQQGLELGTPLQGGDELKKAALLIPPQKAFYKDIVEAATEAFPHGSMVSTPQLQKNYIQALKKVYQKYQGDKNFGIESLALYVDAIAYYHEEPTQANHCSRLVDGPLKEEALILMTPILKDKTIPSHPGLLHTYIHLSERDLNDPLGLMAAAKLPSFSNGQIAHYSHMPNHIYWRRGLYDKAIQANWDAIAIDKQYFKEGGVGLNSYYYEYHYLHSNHFLSILGILTNNYSLALDQAKVVKALMDPKRIEGLKDYRDIFFSLEHLVNLRFENWQAVLNLKTPVKTQELGLLFIQFSRTLAHLNLNHMQAFKRGFEQLKQKQYQRDNLRQLQTLVVTYLQASLMASQNQTLADIEQLFIHKGIDDIENKLSVMNPPLWFFPYSLLLSDIAYKRGDLKAALKYHQLFNKRYPKSTLGKKYVGAGVEEH